MDKLGKVRLVERLEILAGRYLLSKDDLESQIRVR